MDWRKCLKERKVKGIIVDKHLIASLKQGAEKKRRAQKALSLEFAESKFSIEYDALRMFLEALAIQHGHKI